MPGKLTIPPFPFLSFFLCRFSQTRGRLTAVMRRATKDWKGPDSYRSRTLFCAFRHTSLHHTCLMFVRIVFNHGCLICTNIGISVRVLRFVVSSPETCVDMERESSKLQITIEIEKTRREEWGRKSQQGGRGSKSRKIGTSQNLQVMMGTSKRLDGIRGKGRGVSGS